jgi:hypothetical protein
MGGGDKGEGVLRKLLERERWRKKWGKKWVLRKGGWEGWKQLEEQ